jgi:hypothetical protein
MAEQSVEASWELQFWRLKNKQWGCPQCDCGVLWQVHPHEFAATSSDCELCKEQGKLDAPLLFCDECVSVLDAKKHVTFYQRLKLCEETHRDYDEEQDEDEHQAGLEETRNGAYRCRTCRLLVNGAHVVHRAHEQKEEKKQEQAELDRKAESVHNMLSRLGQSEVRNVVLVVCFYLCLH